MFNSLRSRLYTLHRCSVYKSCFSPNLLESCCVIKAHWRFCSLWGCDVICRLILSLFTSEKPIAFSFSFSMFVRKTNNLDLHQLESQHRKSGATQERSQVKIQLDPAISNS